MIKILVVDDHAIVREGLRQIVSDTVDMVVSDEACTGEEALEKAVKNDYDIVLLDITMPRRSGFDVLKQLVSQKPAIKILVLTMHPEEQYAMRILKAGASGYLTKESAPQELIYAIRKVASGGRYVSSSLAEELAFNFKTKIDKPFHQTLSDREFQVMNMIVSGKRPNEIARELSLSVKTVSTYHMRILEKMKVKSDADLVRYAINNHLTR